ncbi:hypothetical protein [Endozoicomonas sp. ALD040]|uniref:hypothetical protein n=1 Tax=unclassified Endozoicomonas TaxID=2644528 RepID=UPI003BAEEC4D
MRHFYSLILLAFTSLAATFSYATPALPPEITLVLCAPKGTTTDLITEMGIARFDYKINPVKAAALVQKTISDHPLHPKVVCTGEISKIMEKVKIGSQPAANDNDQEAFRKIADAVAKTEKSSNLFRKGDHEFYYRTVSPENSKEILMEPGKAQALYQKDSGIPNAGISDYMNRNSGTLLLLPPLVFAASGASEYTIYYILALGLGISFQQTGIWNSLTILALNTAGIAAQAGLLFQQNKGGEFQDEWDTNGYSAEAVKEEYEKLRASEADYNTVATTSWAILTQQVAATAFTFSAIKLAAAKYLSMGTTQALGVSFGQAAFNIIFESITGYPLEDCIPIFKYDKNYSAISARNWPYYGKKFVATNFFMIHWAAKHSGFIARKTAWLGGHLGRAASFLWKKKQD